MAAYIAAAEARRHASWAWTSPTAATSPTATRSTSPASSTSRSTTACARTTSASTTTQVRALAREHKPKVIVVGASAYPRIIDFATFRRDRRRGGRHAHGGHGPHRRPGRRRRATPRRCRTPTSSPPPRTRRCAARAAAWSCARRAYAKDLDSSVFPGIQGGPLDARHRRQGRGLQRGAAARRSRPTSSRS